jgi:hypothetical protein
MRTFDDLSSYAAWIEGTGAEVDLISAFPNGKGGVIVTYRVSIETGAAKAARALAFAPSR